MDILPSELATVALYNSSRGQTMEVHNLRGGKHRVPHQEVTVVDILRLVVEEETRKTPTRIATSTAFDNFTLQSKESWLAATTRLLKYFRASIVDPDAPYNTETEHFFSLLTAANMDVLQETAVRACFPSPNDRMIQEATLNIRKGIYRSQMAAWPIIRVLVGADSMVERGIKVKAIFTDFTNYLSQEASNFISPQKTSAKTVDVNAVATNKLPLQMRMSRDAGIPLRETRKSSSLFATGATTPFDDCSEDYGEQPLAAVTARQDQGSQSSYTRKRGGEDAEDLSRHAPRPRRRDQDDTASSSRPNERRTFSQGARANDQDYQKRRQPKRGNIMKPPGQLAPDAPSPNSSDDDIRKYIIANGVCFYHARGQQCPNMAKHLFCRYQHSDHPVPFGSYPRQSKQSNEKELAMIQLEQLDHQEASKPTSLDDFSDSERVSSPIDNSTATEGHEDAHN